MNPESAIALGKDVLADLRRHYSPMLFSSYWSELTFLSRFLTLEDLGTTPAEVAGFVRVSIVYEGKAAVSELRKEFFSSWWQDLQTALAAGVAHEELGTTPAEVATWQAANDAEAARAAQGRLLYEAKVSVELLRDGDEDVNLLKYLLSEVEAALATGVTHQELYTTPEEVAIWRAAIATMVQ